MSPVWYAASRYTEFYWVSSPEATHSRNLATRPEVSVVIFDSRAPVGSGQAVYMSALAEELTGADLDRATATEHWVLDPAGHPVHGDALDYRSLMTV